MCTDIFVNDNYRDFFPSAGLVFNGLPILEKAAEGNRRITIEGDVRLNR